VSVDEPLNLVHFGPLESIRFVSHLRGGRAQARAARPGAQGKVSPVPAQVGVFSSLFFFFFLGDGMAGGAP
jgi:hypothetical protein